MESGFEHRQAGPRVHAHVYQAAVTMRSEISVLTEEKTDKATSNVIFGTDECCNEN